MGVPRYTTPTFVLEFQDEHLDLTSAYNVYVTFTSNGKTITKTGGALEVQEKKISVYLSQEDTGKFADGYVEIQANWTTSTGSRGASEIALQRISRQLLEGVVE